MDASRQAISVQLERQTNLLELINPAGIQARFEKFHAENPHVYRRLRELVLEDIRRGVAVAGIDLYVSVLRWKIRMETHGDEFKINNSFRSRYARLLMEQEPELKDCFNTRRLESA